MEAVRQTANLTYRGREAHIGALWRYPADLMAALLASTRANSVRNDDSGLLWPDDALAA
jgi:hypothetical protein